MQVYDKVIETTRELLKPFPVKELNRNHAKPWNLLKENEFLLQKEVAFELGIRSQPSTCYQAVTSSKELLPEDKILLYGPDLPEIKRMFRLPGSRGSRLIRSKIRIKRTSGSKNWNSQNLRSFRKGT